MEIKKTYPIYNGSAPCDQIIYRVNIIDPTLKIKAIGIGGSNEPIDMFYYDGYWHIKCPVWSVNPSYIKFENMETKKTPEEIENLKTQWKQDPCWDIEDTEGFEDHKDELIAFRGKHEEECRKSYEKHRQSVKERIYSLDLNETCRDGVAVYLKVPG